MEDNPYNFLKSNNINPQLFKLILGHIYQKLSISVHYGKVYSKYSELLDELQVVH